MDELKILVLKRMRTFHDLVQNYLSEGNSQVSAISQELDQLKDESQETKSKLNQPECEHQSLSTRVRVAHPVRGLQQNGFERKIG